MSSNEQDTDIRDSTTSSAGSAGAASGMGVSSERSGPTGPGQVSTDGVVDTSPAPEDHGEEIETGDPPPEQSSGGFDINPDPPAPAVAGYNSRDPRSDEHPYQP